MLEGGGGGGAPGAPPSKPALDNWPVTTTNHLPPHLANYLGHQRMSVFV